MKEDNFYNPGNEPISSEDELEEKDRRNKKEGKQKISEQQDIEKKKNKELNIITEVEEMIREEKKVGNNPKRKDSDDIF